MHEYPCFGLTQFYLVLGSSLAALVVPNPVTVATEFTAGLEVVAGRHTGEIGPRGKG